MKKLLIAFLMTVMPLCANAALSPSITLTGDCMVPVARHVWGIEDNSVYAFLNSLIGQFKKKRETQTEKRGLTQEEMIMACLASGKEVTSENCANTTDYECYADSDCAKFIMASWECESRLLEQQQAMAEAREKAFPCTDGKRFEDSDFCQHTFFKDISVGKRQADKLIQVWSIHKMLKEGADAEVHRGMICDDVNVKDNCMQCKWGQTNVKFEFCFASLEEPLDRKIQHDVLVAGCKLFDTELKTVFQETTAEKTSYSGAMSMGMDVGGMKSLDIKYHVCSGADDTKCKMMAHDLFASMTVKTKYIDGVGCVVGYDDVNNEYSLERVMGVDPFYFCKQDVQVQADSSLEAAIQKYYFSRYHSYDENEFVLCDAGHRIYIGDGCDNDEQNAVLRCYHYSGADDNKPLAFDMVFADLSEWNRQKDKASKQILKCTEYGGRAYNENCFMANRQVCEKLILASASDCPYCAQMRWDPVKEVCLMPDVKTNQQIELGVRVASKIVEVSVVAVATGGVGAVGIALVDFGQDAIDWGTEMYIDDVVSKFIVESRKCKSSSCASKIFEENYKRITNYTKNHLSENEISIADDEMVRLIGLLDTQYVQDRGLKIMQNSGKTFKASKDVIDFFRSNYEPVDFLRAFGTVLTFVDIDSNDLRKMEFASLTKTAGALKDKFVDLFDDANDANRMLALIDGAHDIQGITEMAGVYIGGYNNVKDLATTDVSTYMDAPTASADVSSASEIGHNGA